jgi:Ser/Thr protein kinase RdoA (MazF antagonist)
MLDSVLKEFDLFDGDVSVMPLHQGLINHTWKIDTNGQFFILQKVNDNVFKQPEDISHNISLIADYLAHNKKDYFFVTPLLSKNQKRWVYQEGYYRVFPFVNNSVSLDVVQTPQQAYEAARQFGQFTSVLKGFDATQLKITIPDFHNVVLRYQQFLAALKTASKERLQLSTEAMDKCKLYKDIVDEFEKIKSNPQFKIRVTHYDTKISNVLLDKDNKGICVIDLDTVMPGYFISDVGDMMRTYLCPVSEEEIDLSKITIRKEMYEAIVTGYYQEMKDELTDTEKRYFVYAGKLMIYMQAVRFLTDFLNDDIYYGCKYPLHNLNRANNQLRLLEEFIKVGDSFTESVLLN